MTALVAAAEVLRKEGTSLPVRRITERMIELGLWTTRGTTPWATVNARISSEIKSKGEQSRFVRIRPGVYDLKKPSLIVKPPESNDTAPAAPNRRLSFTDAAERVLRENHEQESLHYREITQRILDLGLVATKSKTPSDTLSSSIGDEIRRRANSDKPQRFVRLGQGLIGLADAESDRNPKPSVDANQTAERSGQTQADPKPKLSYTDAAEQVLRENHEQESLHYREITQRILDLGLVATKSKTPSDTLSSSIGDEIRRRANSDKPQRFVRLGQGLIGLADAESDRNPKPSVDANQTAERSGQTQADPKPKLSYTDAAEQVLRENHEQESLHYREIAQRILDLGLVATKSKTPSDTLSASISDEIRRRDKSNKPQRFVRLGQGLIGLADAESDRNPKPSIGEIPTSESTPQPKLSYTDAAERILSQNDGQEPLHYREIARRMLDLKLVETRAVTPAYTLNAAISDEIRRRTEANRPQRFVRLGHGLIGLADAEPVGVRRAIDAENSRVRDALLDFLRSTDPVEFEHLVGELINAMGAESVEVTQRSGDGGVDVRALYLRVVPFPSRSQLR